MIYFVQRAEGGPIKIGTTKDLRKRVQSLRIGSGSPLRILAVIEGGLSEEREIHLRFNSLRLDGEWFSPNDDLMGYLMTIGDPVNGLHPLRPKPNGIPGRPKKAPGEARDARIHIRVRRVYADWLKTLATAADKKDITSLVIEMAAEKAKKLKHDPPPDR